MIRFFFIYGMESPGKGIRENILRSCAFLVLFPAIFVLSSVLPVYSQTIAVFPVEDLSKGVNSPNMMLTRYLSEELQAKGLDIVHEDDVMSFMVNRRIRWLGYLNTDLTLQVRDNLGADIILLGTILQQQQKSSPSFGLSLKLVRTKDAKTVWSASGGLSLADMQRLLGLNEPTTVDELWPVLVRNVLAKLPEDFDGFASQPLLFDLEAGDVPPTLQIKHLRLSPRYVRPGEQVKCAVELESKGDFIDEPQVFIRAGNRVHLAQQFEEGMFFEASWTGSEIEKGIFREVGHEALKLAATDLSPLYFEGVWAGLDEDDVYPVNLILKWPNGGTQVAFIGNYTVDSSPPDLSMNIKGAMQLNDLPTFNNVIKVLPKMKVREPASRWKIWVEDDIGQIVLQDEADGRLPRNFYWAGQKFNGQFTEDGFYRMILKVWDRAGNDAVTSQEIVFLTNPPDVLMEVKKDEQVLHLNIDRADDEAPLEYWDLEVWTESGDLLKAADGTELPIAFDIPIHNDKKNEKIIGTLVLLDALGNKNSIDMEELLLMALQKDDLEEQERTSETPEEEDDSWASVSDF